MQQSHKNKRIFKYIRYLFDAIKILFSGQRDFVMIKGGHRYGQLMMRSDLQAIAGSKKVVFYEEPVANGFAVKKWSEVFAVNQGGWVLWRLWERFKWPKICVETRAEDGYSSVGPSESRAFIKFSDQEKAQGWGVLKKKGIRRSDKIICVHSRDEAYMENWQPELDHSFRGARNTDSDILIKSIKYLIGEGFKVVRVGALANKKIPIKSDAFWDYAMDVHDEFLDLFLMSVCRCVIATSSGVTTGAFAFRKPCLLFDFFPVNTASFSNKKWIIVPKKVYRGEQMLSWSEMINVYGRSSNIMPTTEELAGQGLRAEGVSAEELAKYVSIFVKDYESQPAVRMLPKGRGENVAVLEQFIIDNPELFK